MQEYTQQFCAASTQSIVGSITPLPSPTSLHLLRSRTPSKRGSEKSFEHQHLPTNMQSVLLSSVVETNRAEKALMISPTIWMYVSFESSFSEDVAIFATLSIIPGINSFAHNCNDGFPSEDVTISVLAQCAAVTDSCEFSSVSMKKK